MKTIKIMLKILEKITSLCTLYTNIYWSYNPIGQYEVHECVGFFKTIT